MLQFLIVLALGFAPAPDDCARAALALERAAALGLDGTALASREELFREAIEACPSSAEAQNNLGDTLERLGRLDEAVAAYRHASELKPAWALPYFGLGDVFSGKKDQAEALYWYRRGLEFDPADEETKKRVDELTADDPKDIVDSRSIGAVLVATRGAGVPDAIALDERRLPFDFDRATLRSEARAQLREIAYALWDLLGTTRGIRIDVSSGSIVAEIAGHADRRGSDAYNTDLARRRAEAVVAELESYGIPRSRLRATSYGRSKPLCTDDDESCHARNRRVEIRRPY